MKDYRRFVLNWIAVTSSPLLAAGIFNLVIDPYGALKTPTWFKINQSKPAQETNGRLFKAIDITRIKPVTLLMGSSRSNYGLDPTHPALFNHQPAYNLALNGANIYEVDRYLEHGIENQKDLNLVVLGIDFFMFNENVPNKPDFSEDRLGKRQIIISDLVQIIFSLDALNWSWKTLQMNREDPTFISYLSDGRHHPRRLDEDITMNQYRFRVNIRHFLQSSEKYVNFRLSQQSLELFQQLIEDCRQLNINVVVFISPSHATQWESVQVAGLWQEFEQWKRELVKITPVWDFSGYNSITTEVISEQTKKYIDSSHYHKEVGDLVLNQILNYNSDQVPPDFGVLLTSDTIEDHLETIREQRKTWANQNPDQVQFVKDIKQQVEQNENPE